MKLTIEIPDNYYYGEEWDEEGNSTVPTPPKGKRAKRERLLDRSFDEWESFRIDIAALVANHLLKMTSGHTHPEMIKQIENHQKLCKHHLLQCYNL